MNSRKKPKVSKKKGCINTQWGVAIKDREDEYFTLRTDYIFQQGFEPLMCE